MAEVEVKDSGKGGKKGQQKKMKIHVDFTPMVDMNMLLITFFMFCTTLSKPQTMEFSSICKLVWRWEGLNPCHAEPVLGGPHFPFHECDSWLLPRS